MDKDTMIALMAASIYPALAGRGSDVQTGVEASLRVAEAIWSAVLLKQKLSA
jgi:hypothetical protein